MKNTISFILPLLIFSHLAQAQEEIKIDSDIPCTFIEDYESKLEFPLDFEFINVEIKWIVSFDSILEESWDPYFDKNRTQKDLLFTTFLRGQAMDMTTGNWCLSGDWRWTFLKKNGKWIAVNHEINVATGKLTRTNNYSWNKTFAEWGDYYVLTAFDGDVDHLFLSMKNYEKYYKIKFVTEQELPCDLDHVVYDGKIRFASTESLDESVAYFNCNGKTHIMGIKLLENTKRKYD